MLSLRRLFRYSWLNRQSTGFRLVSSSTSYVCSACRAPHAKWSGKCTSCSEWNTVIEAVNTAAAPATKSASRLKQLRSDSFKAAPPSSTAWIAKQSDTNDDGPEPLMSDSTPDEASAGFAARIPRIRLTQSPEVNRTFGGGIVPGSLTLLAGDPGIGKSTLVLQLTRWLADALPNKPVLYVSGEETSQQLRMRADRLSISSANCLLWNESDVDRILEKAASINAGALVLDSVQTMQCADIAGTPGAVSQLREVTARCLRAAKSIQLPVILIGHVTKSGEIAGPRTIEHMVDCALYLEGDRFSSCRMLRVIKNRFGSNTELAVLEMTASGLSEVSNPSRLFLSADGTPRVSGCAITATVDGSRPLLCEVQAIATANTSGPPGAMPGAMFMPPRHRQNGMDMDRFHLLLAVLGKRASVPVSRCDLFVNVVGGMRLREPAADLAVCAAIASAVRDVPWTDGVAFLGEVGLGGELRAVPQLDLRLREAAKLGIKRCFVPFASIDDSSKSGKQTLSVAQPIAASKLFPGIGQDLELIPCRTLSEVLRFLPRPVRKNGSKSAIPAADSSDFELHDQADAEFEAVDQVQPNDNRKL